ncbi:MAG: class I SAM-dependent methyltransferase [Burkholderiales bacterium]|nr:class I SAM-dependent methyltransferase [Burkholderiales bacterium]
MTPAEIAGSYDQLAEQWNSHEFQRSSGIEQHERAVAFLKERRHALDIGCGSSGRIVDFLANHGFDVEGLDLSPRMIELARRRHPAVTFHHADICVWDLRRRYDFISAWDSIWHVPLACQAPVLRKILRGLTPGGVCIFTMGGLDAPSEHVDAAMGPRLYYGTLGVPATLELLSGNGCICRHLEYDQYPESHLYIIAQRA